MRATFAAIVVLPLVALANAPKADLSSRWRTGEITIDGIDDEWPELARFGADVPFNVGVQNDGEFLYLTLSSRDEAVGPRLLRQGLIVWFDGTGGIEKRFGIRYPLPPLRVERDNGSPASDGDSGSGGGGSSSPRGRPNGRGGFGGRGRDGMGGRGGPPLPANLDPNSDDPRWTHFDVLGPKPEDRHLLSIDDAAGIQVKFGQAGDMLMYELKVPLKSNDARPDAIGADAGAMIGLGLETPQPDAARARPPGGGRGGFAGGIGGSGGRRGGGMGGRPGGDRPRDEQTKPIKAWTTVQLATPPPAVSTR